MKRVEKSSGNCKSKYSKVSSAAARSISNSGRELYIGIFSIVPIMSVPINAKEKRETDMVGTVNNLIGYTAFLIHLLVI